MRILAIALVLVGLLWIGQGLGYVGGSFMTGQREWLYIGSAVALAGALLLAWAWRRPPAA